MGPLWGLFDEQADLEARLTLDKAVELLIHWRLVSRRRDGFVNLEWFWIERYRTVAQVAGSIASIRDPAPEPDPF